MKCSVCVCAAAELVHDTCELPYTWRCWIVTPNCSLKSGQRNCEPHVRFALRRIRR